MFSRCFLRNFAFISKHSTSFKPSIDIRSRCEYSSKSAAVHGHLENIVIISRRMYFANLICLQQVNSGSCLRRVERQSRPFALGFWSLENVWPFALGFWSLENVFVLQSVRRASTREYARWFRERYSRFRDYAKVIGGDKDGQREGSQKLGRGLCFCTAFGMFECASADRKPKSCAGPLISYSSKDHLSTILLELSILASTSGDDFDPSKNSWTRRNTLENY